MLDFLWTSLYWYFRPLIKWFLRKTTRLCELQRLCYGEPAGASRALGVENSLYLSKSDDVKQLITYLNRIASEKRLSDHSEKNIVDFAVFTILRVKCINPVVHDQFVISFGNCVRQIWGYGQLVEEVESLRKTQYDSANEEHEDKLITLWRLLMPLQPLEARVTKQWQEIGFQGDDPKTDFRGMGLLGLENLLYFVSEYPGAASHVLSHSHHPQYGYAFAIVGINLTSMAYHLLKDGTAKTHVYNVCRCRPTMKVFHQLYCYLFYEFDSFWISEKPRDVMEFSFIKEKFENSIRASLSKPSTVFRMNLSVDNI